MPTCLHEELVADAGMVDVVHGCREDDRKRLQVRHDVLQRMQRPEVHDANIQSGPEVYTRPNKSHSASEEFESIRTFDVVIKKLIILRTLTLYNYDELEKLATEKHCNLKAGRPCPVVPGPIFETS